MDTFHQKCNACIYFTTEKYRADGEKPLYRDKKRILQDRKARAKQPYKWWKIGCSCFCTPPPCSQLAKLMQIYKDSQVTNDLLLQKLPYKLFHMDDHNLQRQITWFYIPIIYQKQTEPTSKY